MDKKQYCPLSATEAIDTLEEVAGTYPQHRRAHAKGIGFDATFQPNGVAIPYTSALHLQQLAVPAIVRFSHSSPNPEPTEQLVPIKGMAVQFSLPEGEITNLTMATVPVFITKTPEAFIRLLQLVKRHPLSISEKWSVLKNDPDFKATATILKNLRTPKSFATGHYYSLHAYYLVNREGRRQAVKFEWEPIEDDGEYNSDGILSNWKKDAMEDELVERLQIRPIQFRLVIQLGQTGDPTDDPSIEWPKDREKVNIGILTLHTHRADNSEQIVFDPTEVVNGVECSEDPILQFRSAAYAESARRRAH